MTVEQGLAIIEGIAGNPSGESSSKGSEEKDQDEIQEKVKEAVKKVPDEYKKVFKCKEFANSLEKLLKSEGIEGQKLTIKSITNYIYSDNYGLISKNSEHCLIKIGNIAYDNLHPYGIEYYQLLSEYGILESPQMFTIY